MTDTQPPADRELDGPVTDVERARQEKEALQDQLWSALRKHQSANAHSWALGYAVDMLAPGQVRRLIDAVSRLDR